MNAPFLESSEQLDIFFPASLHKMKLLIFQNISECSINKSIPFKQNKICDLCDIIPDKDNKGRVMVKRFFVRYEEVIDCFHGFVYIPTI